MKTPFVNPNYNENEMAEYENSLKHYRDLNGVIDTSFEEGVEEGKKMGEMSEKVKIAKQLKELGTPIETINQATGLSIEEIKAL